MNLKAVMMESNCTFHSETRESIRGIEIMPYLSGHADAPFHIFGFDANCFVDIQD